MTATAGERYDRQRTRWGQGTEMSSYEAAMWHVSDRPTLRASSVVVELLDLTPDWARMRKGHEWALGRIPRLRQRVVSDPVRFGPPAWADTRVELDHHLRRIVLPDGAGIDEVLEVARDLHEETFHPDRPLWIAALVEGLPDGRSAYILKFHHAMADDQALVAMFELLHSHVRVPTVTPPSLPAGHHEDISRGRLSARHAVRAVGTGTLAAARLAGASGRTTVRAVRSPAGAAGRSWAAGRSLRRELASVRGRGPRLIRSRGSGRVFDLLDYPMAELRAAARDHDCGLAELILAAVVGALERYHRALGEPARALTVGVPLRVRFDGSEERGPRAHIRVPAGSMPPSEQIARIRELVEEAESLPHVDLFRGVAPLLSRSPTPVVGRLLERAMRPFAAQTLIIPGLGREAFLAGAQVERMFIFTPTSGCALSTTLAIHQDCACLAINYDTSAIADPGLLSEILREAFDDVLHVEDDRRPADETIEAQAAER